MAMCLLKMTIILMTITITLLKTNPPTHHHHHLLLLLQVRLPSLLQTQLLSLLHVQLPLLLLRILLLLLLLPAKLPPLLAETPNPTHPIFGAVPPNLLSKLHHPLPIPEILPIFRVIEPPALPPIFQPITTAGVSPKRTTTIPAKIPRPSRRNARIRFLSALRWTKLPPCSIRIPPVPRGSAVLRIRGNRGNRRTRPLFHRILRTFHRILRTFHRILRCSLRLPRRPALPDLQFPLNFPRGTAAITCSRSPIPSTFSGVFLAPATSARPPP